MSVPIPQEGFLGDWIDHFSNRIMAPVEFHLSTALAALSVTVGKGVKFNLGGRRFPTLWTLVLAPAGSGKSVATAPLRWAVSRTRSEALLPTRSSPEAFIEAAGEQTDGLWLIGEIAGLIGSFSRGYSAGFDVDLCEVWDHSSVVQRKVKTKESSKNERRLNEPALTAVATGRATDFVETAGLEVFTSGLLSRFLVFATTELPAYRGLSDQLDFESSDEQGLIKQLREIGARLHHPGRPVRAEFSEGFIERWEADDRRWHETLGSVPRHLQGFAKRRGLQALKLGVLHAISRTETASCEAQDASWACQVAEEAYRGVAALAADSEVGMNEKDRARNDLYERARGIASSDSSVCRDSELYRSARRQLESRQQLERMIDIWVESGEVERGSLKGETGRPARGIRFLRLEIDPPEGWTPDP